MLKRTLNRLGVHNVDIVDNGRDAVNATYQKQYDIIFMDMEMPVLDGIGACREITADKTRFLPIIIFVTAHAMESFRADTREAGGHGFVSKPFNLQSIEKVLKSFQWDKLTESERRRLSLEVKTTAGTNSELETVSVSLVS